MKHSIIYTYLITFLALTACTSEEEVGDNISEETEELSEYVSSPCNDFVNNLSSSFSLYLRSKGYDTDGDGLISCSEAENIIHLNFREGEDMYDLGGIEHLVNLKSLRGAFHMNGRTLNLYNNSKLEEIKLDISSSTGYGNQISDLILPNDSQLKILYSPYTDIYNVVNSEKQIQLEKIYMSYGRGSLDLSNSSLLEEINVLVGVVLGDHEYLTSITAGKANVTGVPNLETLILTYEDIDQIDLSKNSELRYLELEGKNLPQLDVTNNKKLVELYLNINLLRQIDLSQNTELEVLEINNNDLESMDLRHNTKLVELDLSNNNLESIDLSENLRLEKLDLANNTLSHLDLTSHKSLEYLDVNNNQLEYLNLKNGNNRKLDGAWFSVLSYMDARNNQVDCIQHDDDFTPSYARWEKDPETIFSPSCY